jgi:phosphopantetheinyl transferase (holo-ACP synthase)
MAIANRVLTERELDALGALPADRAWIALTARFAIKEAIYKAIDPFVRRYVGFREAEIARLDLPPASPLEAPEFQAIEAQMTLAKGEGPFAVEVSWARCEALVLATARIAPLKG